MIRPRLSHMPWALRVLWQPDVELDCFDAKGRPDHGKVFSSLVIVWLLLLDTFGPRDQVSVGKQIVFIAGALGARVFIAMLRSRSVTSTEQILTGTRPLTRPIDNPDAA